MKSNDPILLGSVLKDFLSSSPVISRKIAESRVPKIWNEVVGPVIASHTTSVVAENGKVTVHIDSSVFRHEVFLRRTEIRNALNERLGKVIVRLIDIK